MEQFLRAAEEAQAGATAVSMSFPQKAGEPVAVRTKEPRDWHRVSQLRLSRAGRRAHPAKRPVFRRDRRTQAILPMYPLHIGRFGGRWGSPSLFYGVMALYVVIGVTPFVLMVTGLLMYWKRSFSKKWKRARALVPAKALVPAGHTARVRTSNPAPVE